MSIIIHNLCWYISSPTMNAYQKIWVFPSSRAPPTLTTPAQPPLVLCHSATAQDPMSGISPYPPPLVVLCWAMLIVSEGWHNIMWVVFCTLLLKLVTVASSVGESKGSTDSFPLLRVERLVQISVHPRSSSDFWHTQPGCYQVS